jgi:hypothetical protein
MQVATSVIRLRLKVWESEKSGSVALNVVGSKVFARSKGAGEVKTTFSTPVYKTTVLT